MNPLHDVLAAQIAASGPLPINQFMTTALFHPQYGYYTTQTVFGQKGDFITAPEVSQMFGELIGLALAQTWIDQGCPSSFQLVELGPGRGTLMADILRATKSVNGFHRAAHIKLIEASAKLKEEQQRALMGYNVTWVEDVTDLDQAPVFLVANEFFDALPIRQFQRIDDLWRERMIGISKGQLNIALGGVVSHPYLIERLKDTRDGDIVELCPSASLIIEQISDLIETHGGAAFIFDYGEWRSCGDTLQAIKDHKFANILENIGASDITAHVDFEALVSKNKAQHSAMTPQGIWLERMGITARAQALAKSLSGEALENHILAHRRLTHPDEMGRLFKVIAIYPSSSSCPVGFPT